MRFTLSLSLLLSFLSLPSMGLAATEPSLRALVQASHPQIDELITLGGEVDSHFARLKMVKTRREQLRRFTGQVISSSFREPQFAKISDLEGWSLYREQAIDAERTEMAFVDKTAQRAFEKTLLGQVIEGRDHASADDAHVSSKLGTINGHRYQLSHLSVFVKVADYSGAIAGYDRRGFFLHHDVLEPAPWWWRRAEGEARTRDVFLKIYCVQTMEELTSITNRVGQITAIIRARDCADLLRDYLFTPPAPSR